jgi:hypothetical protein
MRPHGRSRRTRYSRFLIGSATAALAVVSLTFLTAVFQTRAKRSPTIGSWPERRVARLDAPVAVAEPGVVVRPVYPYSVLPGGAYDALELKNKLNADEVAARHYQDFELASLRSVKAHLLPAVYLSYRRGSSIYWTRRPMQLTEGEILLTDGARFARARCGNRISATPQAPFAETEPTEETLNIPELREEQHGSPAAPPANVSAVSPRTGVSGQPKTPPTSTGTMTRPILVPVSSGGTGTTGTGGKFPPTPITPVPEPRSVVLLLTAVAAIAVNRWWHTRSCRVR